MSVHVLLGWMMECKKKKEEKKWKSAQSPTMNLNQCTNGFFFHQEFLTPFLKVNICIIWKPFCKDGSQVQNLAFYVDR